jgi:hypothetical protein
VTGPRGNRCLECRKLERTFSLHGQCNYLVIVVVMMLVAGCTGQPAMKTPANLTTATVTATSIDTTKALMSPVGTACPITENRSSWIRIDPMGSIEKGDTVRISDTTNLPAGKVLELSV